MDFRDSFSRLKKKVKHRMTARKPKPSKTGADIGGERVNMAGLRPGSEPRVVAGDAHDQEANGNGGKGLSRIRLPQPDEPSSMPAYGSVENRGRREISGPAERKPYGA